MPGRAALPRGPDDLQVIPTARDGRTPEADPAPPAHWACLASVGKRRQGAMSTAWVCAGIGEPCSRLSFLREFAAPAEPEPISGRSNYLISFHTACDFRATGIASA